MSEADNTANLVGDAHDEMPFRLSDMTLQFRVAELHPMLNKVGLKIDNIRKELKFQSKLALLEWDKRHWIALALGFVAFLFGSISGEIFDGGNAKLSGIDGMTGAISGFSYFQMLVSVILWVWFAVQVWNLFPIMRSHAMTLLLMWNAMFLAQIMFHVENNDFPLSIELSELMWGTLIVLVVLFLLSFFWKAVSETRDMHVETYHVHEDVRVMEAEMAEHSLAGWTMIFVTWLMLVIISTWSGAHYVSERIAVAGNRNIFLILHLVSGILVLPAYFWVIWFPQRMLGDNTRVQTKASFAADAELSGSGDAILEKKNATCPECETNVNIERSSSGDISIPCPTQGCQANGITGMPCSDCGEVMPTRFTCPGCEINAPALDFLPDAEAW
ncbi:MAG: hypothetical protein OSB30_06200 [Candidatus Poseidoniaceae archaeon]|nr:hypothetical protein [Candidatus Poseidoniaceae archaeon]